MALHHNPRIVTNGLVLALDAGDVNSYPGSGNTLYNVINTSINASLVNGAAFSSDKNGVISFDGADDYAAVNIDLGQNGTISYWFTLYELPTVQGSGLMLGAYTRYILYSNNNTPLNTLYHFMYYDTLSATTGNVAAGHINNIVAGKWYNSTVTWNSSGGFQAYVNGSQTVNTTAANFSSWRNNFSGGIIIGGYRSPQGGGSVHFYNRNLSATEIEQNYLAQKSRFGL